MRIEQPRGNLGLSHLFPTIPVLCFISFFCCVLLLPGIIKTRIFALIFYVLWVGFGSILVAVNMCIWRGANFDAPIYGDIVARVIHIYPITLYLSVFCFGKFTWNITRPASSLKIIDKRKRYNYIDFLLCVGIPLLWTPLLVVTTRGRYKIVEDFGPLPLDRASMDSFLTQTAPLGVIATASTYYSSLTVFNILRARRSGLTIDATGLGATEQSPYRKLSNGQASRYFVLVTFHLIGMPFGFLWALVPLLMHGLEDWDAHHRPWYIIFDIRDNMKQLPLTYTVRRDQLNMASFVNFTGFLYVIPTNGLLFFLLFGLGSDILGIYRDWIDSLRLKIQGICAHSLRRLRKSSVSNALENITPFQPDDILLEPYPSPVRKTTRMKRHSSRNDSTLLPTPNAIAFPSPTSPVHGHSIIGHMSPILPLERARTFHKEPIPARLLPVNGANSLGSPRDASPIINSPKSVLLGRTFSRDSPCRHSPRAETSRHNSTGRHSPPPYEPSESQVFSRQEATSSGNTQTGNNL